MDITTIAVIPALAAVSSVTTIAWRWRLYRPRKDQMPLSAESFSMDRYEPMQRLLVEDDIEFLKTQPGYKPEIGKRMRRQRRLIFQLYLRALAADFHGLHAEARRLLAEAPAEYSGLVPVLFRQQLNFYWVMTRVELRLALGPVAMRGLDVRGLIGAMENMRLELSNATGAAA